MRLNIFSQKGSTQNKEVISVNLKTLQGEITVLDHHRPLLTPLAAGPIKIKTANSQEEIMAGGGFVEVLPKSDVNLFLG